MFCFNKLIRSYFLSRYTRAVEPKTSVTVETLENRALFSATFDPGDTFATALNLGDLVNQRTFTGALNLGNLTDFYKFMIPRGGSLATQFRTNVQGTQIDLFREQIDATGTPQEISINTGVATP